MTDPIYFDTETCGLHGPIVLLQYAVGDGEIHLHEPWREPIRETLAIFEEIANHPGGVIGFNLAFDWFHICQMYTVLSMMEDQDAILQDCIFEYADREPEGRDGPCLKPVRALDLMLHARTGPYQSTMDREDVRIRRVPTALATPLACELDRRVKIKDIYFARRKNKNLPKWQVFDIEDETEETDPDFKDVVLKFAPSSALKTLAADALDLEPDSILLFADIEPKLWPVELGYAPFARAIGTPGHWAGAWPDVIDHHIGHWGYHDLAREYARKDVELTRRLYQHFGCPPLGDDDSELACMVGAVRWRGYRIDRDGIQKLKAEAQARVREFPTAPANAKAYLQEVLSPAERLAMHGTTKKTVLEELAKRTAEPCNDCDQDVLGHPDPDCPICKGTGTYAHPVAARAQGILDARQAKYEIDFYDKLLLANRFHASFVVVGTLSSRMAGSDGLNPQGVKSSDEVRSQFPLSWPGMVLCGGDFSGFEVVLAEACYNDPDLRKDLMTGKKIHALFGQFVFPEMSYDEIFNNKAIYKRCKSAVFAMLYGGEGYTLKERLGVPIEVANDAYVQFGRRYPGVARNRQQIIDMFCTLRQVGGIGSKIEWSDPAEWIESMFGFRRYFTLENKIARALYELASDPPPAWKQLKLKVVRRQREQSALGAVQSALYGATFAIQAANMRAAANHVIQSSGAQITKMVQRKIWDLQPSGVGDWRVIPCNIHDEILAPTRPDMVDEVARVVHDAIESVRPKVPLIEMEWKTNMKTWADK